MESDLKFNDVLAQIISELKGVTMEQAPILFQEILFRGNIMCILGILLAIFLAGLAYFIIYKIDKPFDGPNEGQNIIFAVGAGVAGIFSVPLMIVCISSLITIHSAPRYYVMKEISKLIIKGGGS